MILQLLPTHYFRPFEPLSVAVATPAPTSIKTLLILLKQDSSAQHPSLSHLKRVHKGKVLICLQKDIDLLESSSLKETLKDLVIEEAIVSRHRPYTKIQYE